MLPGAFARVATDQSDCVSGLHKDLSCLASYHLAYLSPIKEPRRPDSWVVYPARSKSQMEPAPELWSQEPQPLGLLPPEVARPLKPEVEGSLFLPSVESSEEPDYF